MGGLILDGLGKRYSLGAAPAGEGGGARQRLARLRRWVLGDRTGTGVRDFWALKDVSFSVEPGTILGIIGPNGAGKSTLLKILARVTLPTTGRAIGHGRLVSLLELGAGFDNDLSARENVVMNAAINGISRSEALARLPRILEFAEIDQFGALPLRHYSSGMFLRLAFSVAVNMEPRILLADEILAVGDIGFQERCLKTLEESGRNGLIVLFVSHDMEAVSRICNRVLWLQGGQVQQLGDPEDVIADYQEAVWTDVDASRFERGRKESRFAVIRGVKLLAADGREIGAAPTNEDVFISIAFEAFKTVSVKGAIDLHARRQLVFRAATEEFMPLEGPGPCELRVRIPANLLTDISYSVTASVTTLREGQGRQYRLVAYNALSFMAYKASDPTVSVKGRPPRTGLLAPSLEWNVVEAHS